jgi:hypothetical protein
MVDSIPDCTALQYPLVVNAAHSGCFRAEPLPCPLLGEARRRRAGARAAERGVPAMRAQFTEARCNHPPHHPPASRPLLPASALALEPPRVPAARPSRRSHPDVCRRGPIDRTTAPQGHRPRIRIAAGISSRISPRPSHHAGSSPANAKSLAPSLAGAGSVESPRRPPGRRSVALPNQSSLVNVSSAPRIEGSARVQRDYVPTHGPRG